MERIRKTVRESVRALRKAPNGISRRLDKLFCKLSEFANKNPDLVEKILPTLLRVQSCVAEEEYDEAFRQLFLLLVLIGVKRRKN